MTLSSTTPTQIARPESYRLFFAVDIGPAARLSLSQAQNNLRTSVKGSVRWTSPENLHVTLKFLGGVPIAQIEHLTAIALEVVGQHSPSTAIITNCGVLGSHRGPHVLVANIHDDKTLSNLAGDLESHLEPMNIKRERRGFVPHVTLGRIPYGRGPAPEVQVLSQLFINIEFPVDRVLLMHSKLGSPAPVYTVISELLLGLPTSIKQSPMQSMEEDLNFGR